MGLHKRCVGLGQPGASRARPPKGIASAGPAHPPNPIHPPAPAQVGDAIAAYLRAADTSKYNEVIAKANEVIWGGLLLAQR